MQVTPGPWLTKSTKTFVRTQVPGVTGKVVVVVEVVVPDGIVLVVETVVVVVVVVAARHVGSDLDPVVQPFVVPIVPTPIQPVSVTGPGTHDGVQAPFEGAAVGVLNGVVTTVSVGVNDK